jgi:aminoglycoside 6'-N-acetyltransferase
MPSTVTLEPFDPKGHRDLLAGWLERPHVRAHWGDPASTLAQCLVVCEGGDQALIVADERPVGFVRWQRITQRELDEAGLAEIRAGTMDIDLLVGEPEALGRGVASQALAALCERLRDEPLLIGATRADHVAAIGAAERAGFRKLREFDDTEIGRAVLMVSSPAERAR